LSDRNIPIESIQISTLSPGAISFNKLTVEEDAKIQLIAQNKISYPDIINMKKIA
jgi:hypothetical protein